MQLANYTEKWSNQLRRWIKPLFVEKQPELTSERCCLAFDTHEIHVLRVDKTAAATTVISNETLAFDDRENLPFILTGFINRESIANVPLYWLLSLEDYQLFLIESFPVEKDEFYEALQWRARSLINYPIEEAVIDYFKLPPKKTGMSNMLAAVIAKKSKLTTTIDTFKQCHSHIAIIDVPELAMRNLTALYEDDEKSTAFIYFYGQTIILNITRQKMLFFTRRIALNSKSDGAFDYEQLSLELLRYFDYYQSQWRHPSPNRVFVAGDKQDDDMLAAKLSEFMLLAVKPFQLKSIHGDSSVLLTIEKNNLLSLGCALREDAVHAETRS